MSCFAACTLLMALLLVIRVVHGVPPQHNIDLEPVIFVHMHKAAGTSFCNLVRSNKAVHARDTHNCNDIGDGPNNTPHDSRGKSCDEREKEMIINAHNFQGLERFLDLEGELCNQFAYITILREPLSRIASHRHFEEHVEKMHIKSIDEALQTFPGAHKSPEGVVLKQHWCQWSVSTLNNYYTRTLNGFDAYMRPAGEITRDDLNRAKTQLEKFKMVVTLERWKTAEKLMQAIFGWSAKNGAHTSKKKGSHEKFEDMFSGKDQATLLEYNALDLELFNYANTLMTQLMAKYEITEQ